MLKNSLYQKNLDYFEGNKPDLFKQIEGKNAGDKYRVYPAAQEGMYIEAAEEGKLLLNSRYNPLREAEIWADKQDLDGKNHVIIFGLGLGCHLEALLRRNPELRFYVYEPDIELFIATLSCRDWSVLPWKQIYLVLEDGRGKGEEFIRNVLSLAKNDWAFISIPAFERCFSGLFQKLAESFSKLKADYLDNLKANIVFEKEWTVNALKNLPCILGCESIFRYRDAFCGRTVVMTASGPSLSEAIPFLKEIKAREEALIVAAGTSINGLLKHGLRPDFFCSYDPFPGNYRALKPALAEGVPLVFGSTINHDVVCSHVGPKAYFILGQDTLFSYLMGGLEASEIIGDAPSIAVVTLRLLHRLGVKEVILAGQDLAFAGGRYYADGVGVARSENLEDKDKAGAFEVPANDGGTVLTNKSFDKMRKNMEAVIRTPGFAKVINTSPGGAEIEGTVFHGWQQVTADLRRALEPSFAGDSLSAILSPGSPSEAFLTEGASLEPSPPAGSFSDTFLPGFSFNKEGASPGLRTVRRRANAFLTSIEENFMTVIAEIKKFLAEDWDHLGSEKQQQVFDRISRYLGNLTSCKEFSAFITPMICNEDHLLRKKLGDVPGMSWEEKKEFISKDLMMYLRGVQASLLKLKEAIESWG